MLPYFTSSSSTLICDKYFEELYQRQRVSWKWYEEEQRRERSRGGGQKICESEGGANRGVFITAWHADFVRSVRKTGEIGQTRERVDKLEGEVALHLVSFCLLFFLFLSFVLPLLISFFLYSFSWGGWSTKPLSPISKGNSCLEIGTPLISSVLSLFFEGEESPLPLDAYLDFETGTRADSSR